MDNSVSAARTSSLQSRVQRSRKWVYVAVSLRFIPSARDAARRGRNLSNLVSLERRGSDDTYTCLIQILVIFFSTVLFSIISVGDGLLVRTINKPISVKETVQAQKVLAMAIKESVRTAAAYHRGIADHCLSQNIAVLLDVT